MVKARIRFLDPVKYLEQSNGEVTEPKTLNFKNRLPVPGGLMCSKIFGPIKDYICGCGYLDGVRYKGQTCERCGIQVLAAVKRRDRSGHMNLNVPVLNPLANSILCKVYGINPLELSDILDANLWIGWTPDEEGQVVLRGGRRVSAVLNETRDKESNKTSSMGLYFLAQQIDTQATAEVQINLGIKTGLFLKRCAEYGNDITVLFITVLPVLPVSLRPYLDKGTYFITNKKNDLYTRLFWYSQRLKQFREMYTMFDLEAIVQYETTFVQSAANALLTDGDADARGTLLKSILQEVKGKTGLVRGNLLGKRADFSGRSVISPGPWLKIDEMGLPRKMGIKLFEPWIRRWLRLNYGINSKQASKIYKQIPKKVDPRLYEALEEITPGKYIIMNRQPTLHRIGMLAFKIVLHSGHSCFLHPMVCAPYNADFDGDQMATHIPLTDEAQAEARDYMMPMDNLLSPLDSSPVIGPSHEMIIGAYNMTRYPEGEEQEPVKTYAGVVQLLQAQNRGEIRINTPVTLIEDDGRRKTCAGRIIIERLFKIEINAPLTKKEIKKLISQAYDILSKPALAKALDELKRLAYIYVTEMGFSVGMTDFMIPSARDDKMNAAQDYADELKRQYEAGEITEDDRVELKIRRWMGTIEELQGDFIREAGPNNSLVVMLETGARVSMTQVSQLVVAKGMQAKSGGSIIEDPVRNCLMTGVDTFEYFMTSYGARKSMADKKMATPKSGYLARRLVNATRDFYISMKDCGYAKEGLQMRRSEVVGRTTIDGELIVPNKSDEIVTIRTPVFCKAERGICTVCYGDDATTRKRIEVGEPVGVIAGQSLTEPCTQMTMKTFHTSGAAELRDSPLVIRAHNHGPVYIEEKNEYITVIGVVDAVTYETHEYMVHKDLCKILVTVDDEVDCGTPLAVYTSKNLGNEDIGGKLDVLEGYYEGHRVKGQKAAVSREEGIIQLVEEDNAIGILINGEVQGKITEAPVFVHDGQQVRKGQFLSYGEVQPKDYEDDIELAATIFIHRMIDLYAEEGVSGYPVHLEMLFRGMSEVVEDEEIKGKLGLLRYGDPGQRKIMGVTELGRSYPSWLKALGFGFPKSVLSKAAMDFAETYDLPTERIMMGECPLFDPVEGEEDEAVIDVVGLPVVDGVPSDVGEN